MNKGSPPQSATFARRIDTKKWIEATKTAIREGRNFELREAKLHTLVDLVDKYLETVV